MQIAENLNDHPSMLRLGILLARDVKRAISNCLEMWEWVSLHGSASKDRNWFIVHQANYDVLELAFDWMSVRIYQEMIVLGLIRECDSGLEFSEGLVLFGGGREEDEDPWATST